MLLWHEEKYERTSLDMIQKLNIKSEKISGNSTSFTIDVFIYRFEFLEIYCAGGGGYK
jgi:hypothetical protein